MLEGLPSPIWAPAALSRRDPTPAEIANGIPCGPADRKLFNEVFRRGLISQAELANLIERAGMVLDPDDMHQVGEAVLRMHRIVEDTTFIVGPGSQFEQLNDVMEYLSPMAIALGVNVTIQLLDHEYQLDTTTGHWEAAHPFGHRINIQGQTLTGAGWPTAAAVRNANPATVEATLRGRFPTVIECAGVSGLFLTSNEIRLIDNVLFIGDFTGGGQNAGLRIGERLTGDSGRGTIRATQVWCHGFGGPGVSCRFQSSITGHRIGSSHNISDGLRSSNQSSINLNYGVLSSYNGGHGIHVIDQGEIQVGQQDMFSEASYIEFNGGNGVTSRTGSTYRMFYSQFRDHPGRFGINALAGTNGLTDVCTFSNNGTDIKAADGSNVRNTASSPALPSMSPAANVTGNANSHIAHS